MLTGKELILATRQYAVEDKAKSWFYVLSTLILASAAYVGAALITNIPIRFVLGVLAGLITIRMFVLYHDFEHHAILNKSFMGKVVFSVFGLLSLAPVSIWKRSHDYHHKHNSKLFSSSIGSYLIITREKFDSLSPAEQRKYLLSRHPLTILFGYFTMFFFGISMRSFLNNPRKHYDSLIAMVIHITLIVLVIYFLGWQAWLFSMFVPFFVSGCLGDYLFYAQHNFPTVKFHDNAEWAYEKAALESSSFMDMGPIMNWFTANIGYHHIHHMNSRIPFYRLPEVMAAFPELQHPKRTSLSLKDISACLKLKVWDPSKDRMVGV
ncbi:MAG TPA: fatty acid desaturase [Bacteroidia bacterium]|nr:fatty acid desaturase [Bacteroidia bacterium]